MAKQAVLAGVKRFIFISSIGVNGFKTVGKPFTYYDSPKPHSPYAISKYEAEIALTELLDKTSMELVIIRPPLIYDINSPGNLKRLVDLVKMGLPLPLAGINNRRSFISLDNLNDLIITVITKQLKMKLFVLLASDGKDISTKDLLENIAKKLNIRIKLFYLPTSLLILLLKLLGKRKIAESLFGDLQIDIEYTKKILNWHPESK